MIIFRAQKRTVSLSYHFYMGKVLIHNFILKNQFRKKRTRDLEMRNSHRHNFLLPSSILFFFLQPLELVYVTKILNFHRKKHKDMIKSKVSKKVILNIRRLLVFSVLMLNY